MKSCFVLQLLLALGCLCFTLAIPQQFQNSKVIRTFQIQSGLVIEDTGIRAKNIGQATATAYYFLLHKVINDHTASVSASLRKQKTELNVQLEGLDASKELYVYKIDLSEHPVQTDEDILLGIKITYFHSIKPLPKKLPQLARQHTTFNFNSYVLTPYPSKEMKTTLIAPSAGILSHMGALKKTSVNGNKVTYGPYENVAPYSFEIATCHFENSKPLLTVTELRRDLEISHWGKNLAVEEHYKLRNDGASLEKEFSRVQYQLTAQVHGQTNVLKQLKFQLPVSAQDPYYRDEVGNVSTSHFRVEKDQAVLEIQPRYPLFGGWNYSWNHGYNADLAQFVRQSKKTGKYILNVKWIENTNDMLIEHAVVRVILPEGAKNIKVHSPISLDSEEIVSHYTFFDSTGRVMVVLEKNNAVAAHELPVQVQFS
ncbi:Ribophorin I [Sporodiniella umbellata]|nr:Ribophorin I [Sporodiniella umbellata]